MHILFGRFELKLNNERTKLHVFTENELKNRYFGIKFKLNKTKKKKKNTFENKNNDNN